MCVLDVIINIFPFNLVLFFVYFNNVSLSLENSSTLYFRLYIRLHNHQSITGWLRNLGSPVFRPRPHELSGADVFGLLMFRRRQKDAVALGYCDYVGYLDDALLDA